LLSAIDVLGTGVANYQRMKTSIRVAACLGIILFSSSSSLFIQRAAADDAETQTKNAASDAQTGTKKEARKAKKSVRKATGNDNAAKDVGDSAANAKDDAANAAQKAKNKANE
jgi:hypothetical protein